MSSSTTEDPLQRKSLRIAETHRLVSGRTALIVVDMQRGFLAPGAALEVPPGREIVPAVHGLLEAAREAGAPVVFTRFVWSPEVPTLRGDPFGPEHLLPVPGEPVGFGRPSGSCALGVEGPESPEIIPELAPLAGELVVDGRGYDKFQGTCLDQALRARDVRWLVIAGIVTDICVNATVLGAAAREYRVTVPRDAVATLWPEIQRACLDIWERKFARIVGSAEAIDELRVRDPRK